MMSGTQPKQPLYAARWFFLAVTVLFALAYTQLLPQLIRVLQKDRLTLERQYHEEEALGLKQINSPRQKELENATLLREQVRMSMEDAAAKLASMPEGPEKKSLEEFRDAKRSQLELMDRTVAELQRKEADEEKHTGARRAHLDRAGKLHNQVNDLRGQELLILWSIAPGITLAAFLFLSLTKGLWRRRQYGCFAAIALLFLLPVPFFIAGILSGDMFDKVFSGAYGILGVFGVIYAAIYLRRGLKEAPSWAAAYLVALPTAAYCILHVAWSAFVIFMQMFGH